MSIFTKIVSGEIPSYKIAEDEDFETCLFSSKPIFSQYGQIQQRKFKIELVPRLRDQQTKSFEFSRKWFSRS